MNTLVNMLIQSGWFLSGWMWCGVFRNRRNVEVVPIYVDRLSPVYQALDGDLLRLVTRARLAGRGHWAWQTATMQVDGVTVAVRMSIDTDQLEAAPEVEHRR